MKLIVDHLWTRIDGKFPEATVDKATSYFVKGSWFAQSARKGHWDGRKRLLDRRGRLPKFPTGLLTNVTDALARLEWEYELDDQRDWPCFPSANYRLNGGIDLRGRPYEYQGEALDAALQHSRGTLVMATGAGKTELGAGIINSIQQPSVWLTHRRNLAYQTQRRLSERLGVKVGFVGDGVIDVQDITVCMVQTLDNADADRFTELRELLDRTEVLICDEVHHLASGSDLWYKNLYRMRAPWRYGLTATPEFEGPGIKLIAHTGGEIYRIEAPELVERGVLVPPRIWIDECEILGLDKKMDWRKAYKAGVVLNLARNRKIVGAAKQWGQVEKRPTIILVRQIQHGKTLMDMLCRERVTCDFIHGGVGETQRELVLSALKDGLLDVVVGQVEVMGEGVDLPWLQCGINAVGQRGGGDASDGSEGETGRQTTQILGRLLRRYPGKEHCDILDFADSGHKLLEKASLARIGTYVAQGHAERIQRWSDYDA